ncbi:MAG: PAS domain S-box protein [Verrucomicrobiota bacterium]
MKLRNLPIKRKLMFVIMLTSTAVLILTSFSLIAYELLAFRRSLVQNTLAIAQIIAGISGPALRFNDAGFATEILSTLRAEPVIGQACLYQGKKIFARFSSDKSKPRFPLEPGRAGYFFEGTKLIVFHPVKDKLGQVGMLYLRTDPAPVFDRLQLYAGIVFLVMASSIVLALILSNWLQKRISAPILELAETAKAVSIKKDYLVRARKFDSDELGLLTDAFNHMLTQIHERDLALTESEARARAVLNSAISGVVVMDASGKITDWNIQAERLFGWTRHEAIGRNLAETIIPLRYREAHQRGLDRFFKTGEGPALGRLLDLNALRRDGTEFPVELSISPIKTGTVTTFCGFLTDVTQRKEAAEALSLLAAIVESSDDAIVGKNLQGIIVSWNAGAERMFGYTAPESVGRESTFVIPSDRWEVEAAILKEVQRGYIQHFETVRLHKDGSKLHVSLTMSPIKNAEGRIIGASASSRDISPRIKAEEEIRNLNTELEERVIQRTAELAHTNKELEAFTYSVSHDLRAPLRHIDAFAQMLEEELKSETSAEGHRYLQRIRHGVQTMGRLVDDLLNLSRVGRMEIVQQTVPLNDIVTNVLQELQPEYEGRNLEWIIGELPAAECDPGLILQVFINLISNSVKYTRPIAKAVIEIGAKTDADDTIIFVRDNGVGFNMKFADKLFGAFQRLHRAEEFEGTGVGLATVQRIIHLHMGRIWVEAELGKGATFYFTLRGIQRP